MTKLLSHARTCLERASFVVTHHDDQLNFEDATVLGFVREIGSPPELIDSWRILQDAFLKESLGFMRSAGQKAWNLYSVFLTSGRYTLELEAQLTEIEENFEATRKIARAGIVTADDVRRALYPLLPIQSSTFMGEANSIDKVRSRLSSTVPSYFFDNVIRGTNLDDLIELCSEGEGKP